MKRNEIILRRFSHAFFGYDVEDVDLFLDEIIREFDRIHNELDIAALKAEAARQREEKLRLYAEKLAEMLEAAGIAVDRESLAETALLQTAQAAAEHGGAAQEEPEAEDGGGAVGEAYEEYYGKPDAQETGEALSDGD